MLQLNWHRYKYYPYEQSLALREATRLLSPHSVHAGVEGVTVEGAAEARRANRLVYFASRVLSPEAPAEPTQQALLERVNGNGAGRQSTRYSAHGLHEYKGKFNPQIAKALLNIFGVSEGQWALDPFCGSGTSLVEASHLGVNAIGTDINPMAVYLANAKLQALAVPAELLQSSALEVLGNVTTMKAPRAKAPREEYLHDWFPKDVLKDIESLRQAILSTREETQSILLALASNLLRDYSLQEPSDLRIRRRTSPFPQVSFLTAFEVAAAAFTRKIADSQSILGLRHSKAQAHLVDCRRQMAGLRPAPNGFDVALTSPPYATALPYIDTQRLSLVWLGLIEPSQILDLESRLIGSREIRGQSKAELLDALLENEANLPEQEAGLCVELQRALGDEDGFRRQAVPRLLYRYFAGMADSFATVHEVVRPGAMYGLIVGGNHTVLGGRRFDVNTPSHLASLAVSRGWKHVETLELQTYKRYGLHARNSSTTEALVVLQK